jgi:ABC-type bacteriocin/lantibiotic exporter with double-glycine peptidase domain
MKRQSKADITPVRQRSQFTCMAASLSMCLKAHALKNCDEDTVNDVMGASPLRGASWEQAIAATQYFGCRATLVTPSTIEQLKTWTDDGIPVMIAWNPEGREWSHASVVFDVDDKFVYIADPNIPDPNETVRVVELKEFYSKWFEKEGRYLIRRSAMAITREVDNNGKQVKTAKLLKRVWTVVDPYDIAELGDILAEWSVNPNLIYYIMGLGKEIYHNHFTIHDSYNSALADAKARMAKLHV